MFRNTAIFCPIHLYLISEKSCWKNWVRRIGFLVHFNCHAYSKLSSTQRFTHRDSISSLVCHKLLWERQCSYSKEKYKWYSKGPIFSEKYWYHFHCLKNVLRSILSFVFWIFPSSDTAVQLESADSKQNTISKSLFQDSFLHIFWAMRKIILSEKKWPLKQKQPWLSKIVWNLSTATIWMKYFGVDGTIHFSVCVQFIS